MPPTKKICDCSMSQAARRVCAGPVGGVGHHHWQGRVDIDKMVEIFYHQHEMVNIVENKNQQLHLQILRDLPDLHPPGSGILSIRCIS